MTQQQTIHPIPITCVDQPGFIFLHLAGSLSMSRRSGKIDGRRSTSNVPSLAQGCDRTIHRYPARQQKYLQPVIYRTSCTIPSSVFRSIHRRLTVTLDINWADVGWIRDYFDHVHMDDHQRVNHFRNHYELTRKDLMVKNLKRMKRQLERTDTHAEAAKYNFFPATFVLPAEYGLFLEEFKRTPGSTWIMKPIGRAQGKGIFLFNVEPDQ